MSQGGNPAFGFTVGPVIPAGRDGAAGEAEAREEAITYLVASFRAVVQHYEPHANPWKDVHTYEHNVQQMEWDGRLPLS